MFKLKFPKTNLPVSYLCNTFQILEIHNSFSLEENTIKASQQ